MNLVPPPLWMLIFGAFMWVLNRYDPVLTVAPGQWSLFGWLVMAIATIPPSAALVQFRRAHTTANPHKLGAVTTLVTSGVYAWTRNPMYLGLLILLIGWAIKLGTLSPWVGPVLFLFTIERIQIGPEERALRRLFPGEYEAYCRSVNRWFGRAGRP